MNAAIRALARACLRAAGRAVRAEVEAYLQVPALRAEVQAARCETATHAARCRVLEAKLESAQYVAKLMTDSREERGALLDRIYQVHGERVAELRAEVAKLHATLAAQKTDGGKR